jgi:hypothetical protein
MYPLIDCLPPAVPFLAAYVAGGWRACVIDAVDPASPLGDEAGPLQCPREAVQRIADTSIGCSCPPDQYGAARDCHEQKEHHT